MKRFISLAAIFVLLALLFVASPVYADPSWVSFSDADHTTDDNDFASPEYTVYMQEVVTASTQYKVAYYEADTDGTESGHR